MSRIGKKPIKIPENVTVNINGNKVVIKGEKGELCYEFKKGVEIKNEDGEIIVDIKGKDRFSKSLHGLYRSLLANMIYGVTKGFNKGLEVVGVGYNAKVIDNNLILNVGFSHPVYFPIPEGINITVSENKINVSGIDKQLVGEVAARIRKIKPPDPYKGKGIRYIGEIVRKKPGKALKAVGGVGAK